jgi:hypothetical protein
MNVNEPLSVSGRLADLFPPDHPDSPWLLRLLILRDDIWYEIINLPLGADSTSDDVWRCSYFLRRLSVSILEARAILAYEGGKASKRARDEVMVGLAPHIKDVIANVEQVVQTLDPIRNAIGAHMRPQNADSDGPCVESRVLQNLPNLAGEATVSFGTLDQTTFRKISMNALLFAWPDIDTDEKHEQRHDELHSALTSSVPGVLRSIDALLVRHWWHLGLLKMPEDSDLAIVDKSSGELRPIAEPPGTGRKP